MITQTFGIINKQISIGRWVEKIQKLISGGTFIWHSGVRMIKNIMPVRLVDYFGWFMTVSYHSLVVVITLIW